MAEIRTDHVVAPDPGEFADQQPLGRVPAIDDRSAAYRMAAPPSSRAQRSWLSPAWRQWPAVLDQGGTSECVAYTVTKFLLTHRIVNRPPLTPHEVYVRAQSIDEWAGQPHEGTSVNAG